MFKSDDDADVRCPGDNERQVEVDDAGRQNIGDVDVNWNAGRSGRADDHVRIDEQRNIKRHVVHPYVGDGRYCHARFESNAAHFLHSQESTDNGKEQAGLTENAEHKVAEHENDGPNCRA